MKTSNVLLSAGIIGAITIAGLSTNAFAWHPKGEIVKKVQNVTASSALSDADTEKTAVAAKPGDTLKYVIEISNTAAPAEKKYNDMVKITMTDTLPEGIELVSNPSQRKITESIDRIVPGQKVTKEYLVKVVAKVDGAITNTACFTGDTEVNDNPQKGCNPAVVKVTVPPVVTPPTKPPVVTPPVTEETPVELPKTGAADSLLSLLGAGSLIAAASYYIASRRNG